MPRLSRKLLVLPLLFWVAPLSAQQRSTAAGDEQWHSESCPGAPARPILVSAEGHPGEVPMSEAARSAYFP